MHLRLCAWLLGNPLYIMGNSLYIGPNNLFLKSYGIEEKLQKMLHGSHI